MLSTARSFPFRPTEFGQTQAMVRALPREQFDRVVGVGRHAFPACVRKLSCYAVGMQAFSPQARKRRGERDSKRERERESERRGQATGEEQSALPLMGMLGGSGTNDHTWVWSWWKEPITMTWHLLPGFAIKQSKPRYKPHLIPDL